MTLPRSLYVSVPLGVAYGVALRLLLGHESLLSGGLVTVSFFVVVPIVVGFISVFLGVGKGASWKYAILVPWIAIAFFLLTTIALLLEGSVCVIVALPGFLALSSVGGLVARWLIGWRVPAASALSCVLVLPLVLSSVERQVPPEMAMGSVTTQIDIAAPTEVVWSRIVDVGLIRQGELAFGLTRLLGVPQPLEAHMELTPAGWIRKTRWERGVEFKEIITDSRENQFIRWSFDFPPSAVPEGVLDEHVRIGGRYFGLLDGGYTLEPIGNAATRLTIRTSYKVAARPLYYAKLWAYVVMSDFHRVILDLIRKRSERGGG